MKTIIFSIICLFLVPMCAAADVSIMPRYNAFTDDHLDGGPGVIVKWMNKNGAYLYGSFDMTTHKWGAQHMYENKLLGAGVGIRRKIANGLSLSCQLGWYQPILTLQDNLNPKSGARSAVNRYAEDQTHSRKEDFANPAKCPFRWENCSIDLDGNVGGEISANFYHNFGGWSIGLDAGYRILSLKQSISLWDPVIKKTTGFYWEFDEDEKYNSLYAGFSVQF